MDAAQRDLLRLTTAGSVDDGKSTLIGRLLLETGSLPADQIAAVRRESQRLGQVDLDLSLFTDGLRDEREQKITIDVAYRYFSTARRKFIIADCPGHLQYTRNMVTGASNSELALILVDARQGLVTQSKRHAFLSSLLGLSHLLVAVNKMDLVDYDPAIYQRICDSFREFALKLEVRSLAFLPLSALHGDNVVTRSQRMPWYQGGTLLHYLETVNVGATRNVVDFRFPVQVVLRPHQDYRGYAGCVVSGRVSVGEEVVVLPSGLCSRVVGIDVYQQPRQSADVGEAVVLRLEDDLDVGRGDLIVRRQNLPVRAEVFDAVVCALGSTPLDTRRSYTLLHGTRRLQARIRHLNYRIDVDTLHREPATELRQNDIGRLSLTTSEALFFDPYRQNRHTGSFLLVDPTSHETVAAGMIRGRSRDLLEMGPAKYSEVMPGPVDQAAESSWQGTEIDRPQLFGHRPAVVWLTGHSGAGKSTLAHGLESRLCREGIRTLMIDGDILREGLCADLGFSAAERSENLRRAAYLAALAWRQGIVAVCSLISPFQSDRALARSLILPGEFLEVHVHCPIEVCQQRDPKGLYARAVQGELTDFTGIDSPYEPPTNAELVLDTSVLTFDEALELLAVRVLGICGRA